MNTPDSRPRTATLSPWIAAQPSIAGDDSRLVVVIAAVSEPASLARRVLSQTANGIQPVLLLGVAPTPAGESELRRSLVAVEAFVAAQGHRVELQTASGRGWLEKIRPAFRPLDLIACYEEEGAGISRQPLSDALARGLQATVHDLTDTLRPFSSRRAILPQVGAWLGSIAILAGFLVLQAKIVVDMQDWTQTVTLVITLVPEIALIWLWNSILG